MAADDDETILEDFRRLVTLLGSSTPDMYTAQRRQMCLDEATKSIEESEDCRAYLASCRQGELSLDICIYIYIYIYILL